MPTPEALARDRRILETIDQLADRYSRDEISIERLREWVNGIARSLEDDSDPVLRRDLPTLADWLDDQSFGSPTKRQVMVAVDLFRRNTDHITTGSNPPDSAIDRPN